MTRDRGEAFDAPVWWLDAARAALIGIKGLVELGEELAALVGRGSAFNHTMLSRLRSGELTRPSLDLALAISQRFGIPRPFFIASTRLESVAIEAVEALSQSLTSVEKKTGKPDLIRIDRISQADRQLGQLETETDGQYPSVESRNEGTTRRSGR